MKPIARLTVTCLLALAATPLTAEEIIGQVGAVGDNQIAIIVSGEFDPQPGDKFTVVVDVPGVGEAVIAQGQVSGLDDGIVLGTIVSATGKITEGHRVRIDSPQAVRRRPAMPAPIAGQIGAVVDRDITIITRSQTEPGVGDKVEVFAEVPGADRSIVGVGKVTALKDGLITARIDQSTGALAFGQQVKITPAAGPSTTAGEGEVFGLRLDPVEAGVAELLDLPSVAGLVIRSVAVGSAGEVAGLKKRDVLLRANGVALNDSQEFRAAMSKGSGAVKLDVWRDGASVSVDLAVSAQPGTTAGISGVPAAGSSPRVEAWIGLYLDNHRDFVRVRAVIPGSPAAKAGLRAGDRLKSLDGNEIAGRAIAFNKLWGIPVGMSGRLEFIRGGTALTAVLVPEPKITDEQLFAMMNRMAEDGDPIAAHEVGMMWQRGQGGIAKNPQEAVRWLRIAANGRHAQGQFHLGHMLIYAEGIEVNGAEGAEWVRRAAEQDDPDGVLLLARLYQRGYGVEQSDSEARRWFQVSLAQGALGGIVEVARLHADGALFEKDDRKAAELFRIAAERDSVTGQREWGLCLRNGTGVAMDRVAATGWLRQAAQQGDGPARAALEEMGEPVVKETQSQSPPPQSAPTLQPALSPVPEISRSTRLVPTDNDRQMIRALADALPRKHISSHPLDDEIADRTIQLFVETLDPGKRYFTQQDVEGFRNRHMQFDDQLKQGDLTPAMEIFGVYVDRVRASLVMDQGLLNQQLDFGEDEWLGTADKYVSSDQEWRDSRRRIMKFDLLTHEAAGADADEAKRRVLQAIHRQLESIGKYDSVDVTEWLGEALCDSFDPNTSFYSNRQLQQRIIGLAGELVGVGMSLEGRDGYTVVTKILPKGPAAALGVFHAGDRIVAVGEGDNGEMVDVVGLPLNDVVAKIRGTKGARVRLRVIPKGAFEATVHALQRDRVDISNFGAALLTGNLLGDRPGAKAGYIYLPTFTLTEAGKTPTQGTFVDVKRELEAFRKGGAEVVVIDLRENSGGSLYDAIIVSGLFLGPQATVTQVKNRDGTIDNYLATDIQAVWDGPVVVLTSSYTAGGAEILAAAIQDQRAGLVIGDEKTIGLGTVTSPTDLNPAGATGDKTLLGRYDVVTAKFYRANGDGLQQRGVASDVVFPSIYSRSVYNNNRLRRYALQFDQIAAVSISPRGSGPKPAWLDVLTRQSAARRASSEWFQKLADELNRESQRPGEINLRRETFLADRAREDSLAVREADVPGIPDVNLNGYLREALAIALDYAARAYCRTGDAQVAQRQAAQAIRSYTTAVSADPDYAEAHNKLAWILSTCGDASLRDGARARQMAERANQLSGNQNWRHVLTLAIASAQAGDFEAALKNLKMALDAAPPNERPNYQYLEQRFQQRRTFAPKQ